MKQNSFVKMRIKCQYFWDMPILVRLSSAASTPAASQITFGAKCSAFGAGTKMRNCLVLKVTTGNTTYRRYFLLGNLAVLFTKTSYFRRENITILEYLQNSTTLIKMSCQIWAFQSGLVFLLEFITKSTCLFFSIHLPKAGLAMYYLLKSWNWLAIFYIFRMFRKIFWIYCQVWFSSCT